MPPMIFLIYHRRFNSLDLFLQTFIHRLAMLDTLEPEVVLVYGAMPSDVFGDYLHCTEFIKYPDWTTRMHGGDR